MIFAVGLAVATVGSYFAGQRDVRDHLVVHFYDSRSAGIPGWCSEQVIDNLVACAEDSRSFRGGNVEAIQWIGTPSHPVLKTR